MLLFHRDERGQALVSSIGAGVLGLLLVAAVATLSYSMNKHMTRDRHTGMSSASSTSAQLRMAIGYNATAASNMASAAPQTLSDGTVIMPSNSQIMVRNNGATSAIVLPTSVPSATASPGS